MASDPWADQVISYAQGTNSAANYNLDPTVALGSPERITGENTPFGPFPGGVTMFNSPWGTDEIISIGAGGELLVQFDDAVEDDPTNPFGVDLIIFGNSFFIGADGITGFAEEPGIVELSDDGIAWHAVNEFADSLFPTQGFLDAGVFGDPFGSVATDFLKPVNPSLTIDDFLEKTYAEALDLYDGSGGGTPIDIGQTGLSSISFVRISVPSGANFSTEIDAFANVPEPSTAGLLAVAAAFLRRRRGRALTRI